jgi:hypothetical protein
LTARARDRVFNGLDWIQGDLDVPRRLIVTVCLLCLPGVVLADEDCTSIEGLAERIAPGRIFLFGEIHGTEQSPAFVAEVACAVAKTGNDVVVGLELVSSAQGLADRYLNSPGRPVDRDALLQHDIWTRSYQDGRNSAAMVELIERVRRLKWQGRSVRVLYFDPPAYAGGQDREAKMAATIAASAERHPEAVHVILTGNAHSRTAPGNRNNPGYMPMGALLQRQVPGDRIVALDVAHEGGSAWICAPSCGAAFLAERHGGERWSIEIDDASRPPGHLGWYRVGTISASPPAVGDHDVPDESPVPAEPEAPEEEERETDPPGSAAVDKLQGAWQAHQNGTKSWTIRFDGLEFHAVVGPDDWYRGRIFVRHDEQPSEIDFLIEDCVCGYKGESSDGIYRWDEDTLTLGTPMPGTRRPTFFNEQKGEVVTLRRVDD